MMKQLILAGLVFVLATANGVTEEKPATVDEQKPGIADAELKSVPIAEAEAEAEEDQSAEDPVDEWKPHFMITLQTSAADPGTRQQQVAVPYYKTEYEEHDGFDGKTQQVAVRKLAYRKQIVTVQRGRNAIMLCDALNFSLMDSKTADCEFECPGKLRLFVGAMSISAESGTLSNGRLQLVNAEIKQMGTTATAEKLVLTLPVKGVATDTFDCTLPDSLSWSLLETPTPLPLRSLNRNVLGDDRSVPTPQPDDAFNSEPTPFPYETSNRAGQRTFDSVDEPESAVGVFDGFPAIDPLPTIIR